MIITELVLDGFKSYPVRTRIEGWDSSFNAITGLNGSGKSNILDAICFVLGITNLSTVRASNLLDLIYKRGQAGVTRASVTIVFDNSDKSKAPVGFDKLPEVSVTRQIHINGTSKYLINGHRSTQAAVQNLFQSVGLNINNPNFVIMQGKITKVLNMRPQEILSMIEEAAGTSMFEDKKEKAVKNINKKEKQLQEIQDLLREEITPKLDKLREEKRAFLEFQKKSTELEKLSKLVIAYDWTKLSKFAEQAASRTALEEKKHADLLAERKRIEAEIATMQQEIAKITKQRDAESAKGGKVPQLEKEQKSLALQQSKTEAQVEIATTALEEEKETLKALRVSHAETQKAHVQKSAQLESHRAKHDAFRTDYDASREALASAEALLQSLETGVSDDASGAGFLGQLAAARSRAAAEATTVARSNARISHLTSERKKKAPRAERAAADGKALAEELAAAEADIAKMEKLAGADEAANEADATLQAREKELVAQIKRLSAERDKLSAGMSRLDFVYTDPRPDFDRSLVKGPIAKLIDFSNTGESAGEFLALETAAGGRLYHIVVSDENVGADLLARGRLRTRATLIPLTKVRPNMASPAQLAAAKKISSTTSLALDLIRYPRDVTPAMQFVFGNTLVCPDAGTANSVTFAPGVRMRSVTLAGDVYDPSGTLSGGSAGGGGGLLERVAAWARVGAQISALESELSEVRASLSAGQEAREARAQRARARDLAAHQLTLLRSRVSESAAARATAEIAEIDAEIKELRAAADAAAAAEAAALADATAIEEKMAAFESNRGGTLAQLRKDIAGKKRDAEKATRESQALQGATQAAELELAQLAQDCAGLETEIAAREAAVAAAEAEAERLRSAAAAGAAALAAVASQIADETGKLRAFRDELDALAAAGRAREESLAEVEVRVQESAAARAAGEKEERQAASAREALETSHPWIADEFRTFGRPDSPYNYGDYTMSDVKEKCAQLGAEQAGLRKQVNPSVLATIDSVEKRERDLTAMYRQVLRDRAKIEETIARLDAYKKDALEKTWVTVDREFGNIFADLLPGNFAKLQPPEGMEITQGLEVKVRLGAVWKASLTELSGGQRSLIALSLIMALLHFKPAPMYILDEIDAALDLSHTENIGRLIRTRFKGSQFIVVSLKDGLFSNAPVLFRARFRDGTSVVERTTQRPAVDAAERAEARDKARGKRRAVPA